MAQFLAAPSSHGSSRLTVCSSEHIVLLRQQRFLLAQWSNDLVLHVSRTLTLHRRTIAERDKDNIWDHWEVPSFTGFTSVYLVLIIPPVFNGIQTAPGDSVRSAKIVERSRLMKVLLPASTSSSHSLFCSSSRQKESDRTSHARLLAHRLPRQPQTPPSGCIGKLLSLHSDVTRGLNHSNREKFFPSA